MLPALRITNRSPGSLWQISFGTTRESEQVISSAWALSVCELAIEFAIRREDVRLKAVDTLDEFFHEALPIGVGSCVLTAATSNETRAAGVPVEQLARRHANVRPPREIQWGALTAIGRSEPVAEWIERGRCAGNGVLRRSRGDKREEGADAKRFGMRSGACTRQSSIFLAAFSFAFGLVFFLNWYGGARSRRQCSCGKQELELLGVGHWHQHGSQHQASKFRDQTRHGHSRFLSIGDSPILGTHSDQRQVYSTRTC